MGEKEKKRESARETNHKGTHSTGTFRSIFNPFRSHLAPRSKQTEKGDEMMRQGEEVGRKRTRPKNADRYATEPRATPFLLHAFNVAHDGVEWWPFPLQAMSHTLQLSFVALSLLFLLAVRSKGFAIPESGLCKEERKTERAATPEKMAVMRTQASPTAYRVTTELRGGVDHGGRRLSPQTHTCPISETVGSRGETNTLLSCD